MFLSATKESVKDRRVKILAPGQGYESGGEGSWVNPGAYSS